MRPSLIHLLATLLVGLGACAQTTSFAGFTLLAVCWTAGPLTADQPLTQLQVAGSTAVAGHGLVYVNLFGMEGNDLQAFDAYNGTRVWNLQGKHGSFGSPGQPLLAPDGALYVGIAGNDFFKVDALTGGILWRLNMPADFFGPPAYGQGLVFFGTGSSISDVHSAESRHVYALRVSDGSVVWTYPTGLDCASGALYLSGLVYIATRADSFLALNATTGELVWSVSTSWQSLSSNAPTHDSASVFFGDDFGWVHAADLATGNVLWKQMLGYARVSGVVYSNGSVCAADVAANVAAYNAVTGALRWSRNVQWSIAAPCAVADGVLYVPCANGSFFGLSLTDGTSLIKYGYNQAGWGGVTAMTTPLLANGMIYQAVSDGRLYALSTTTQICTTGPSAAPRAPPPLWLPPTQDVPSLPPPPPLLPVSPPLPVDWPISSPPNTPPWYQQSSGPVPPCDGQMIGHMLADGYCWQTRWPIDDPPTELQMQMTCSDGTVLPAIPPAITALSSNQFNATDTSLDGFYALTGGGGCGTNGQKFLTTGDVVALRANTSIIQSSCTVPGTRISHMTIGTANTVVKLRICCTVPALPPPTPPTAPPVPPEPPQAPILGSASPGNTSAPSPAKAGTSNIGAIVGGVVGGVVLVAGVLALFMWQRHTRLAHYRADGLSPGKPEAESEPTVELAMWDEAGSGRPPGGTLTTAAPVPRAPVGVVAALGPDGWCASAPGAAGVGAPASLAHAGDPVSITNSRVPFLDAALATSKALEHRFFSLGQAEGSQTAAASTASSWGVSSDYLVGVKPLPSSAALAHPLVQSAVPRPITKERRPLLPTLARGSPHLQPDASAELQARMMRDSQALPGMNATLPGKGLLPSADLSKMDVGGVQWTQGALIERGGNGAVYVGHDYDGALIAIKVQPLPCGSNQSRQKLLLQELSTLQKLKHTNVVEYLGSAMDDHYLYIFMSYEPQCLSKLLKNGLSESVVRKYTRQILMGLEYVHSQGVSHRDIKAANLLVGLDGVVKLTDFGAAKVHQVSDGSSNLKSITGTPHWMAPEMCLAAIGQGRGYSGAKADVWSLGVTVVEMMMGGHPWKSLEGLQAIWQVAYNLDGLPRPQHASAEALNFLDACLQRDPAKRATVAQLLVHPFVALQDEAQDGMVRRTPLPRASSSSLAPTNSLSRTNSLTQHASDISAAPSLNHARSTGRSSSATDMSRLTSTGSADTSGALAPHEKTWDSGTSMPQKGCGNVQQASPWRCGTVAIRQLCRWKLPATHSSHWPWDEGCRGHCWPQLGAAS